MAQTDRQTQQQQAIVIQAVEELDINQTMTKHCCEQQVKTTTIQFLHAN